MNPANRRISRAWPYLEHQVRKWVRALPNVTIWDRCEVAGLVTTPARDRVTGARVRPRTGGAGEEQILAADLVVDATGRTGRTVAWLKELGYDPPAGEQIRVDIKYASRYLRPRHGALGEEKLVMIGRESVGSASGAASPMLIWRGRMVRSLGPGLTFESADAARAVLRNDLSAGSQFFWHPPALPV